MKLFLTGWKMLGAIAITTLMACATATPETAAPSAPDATTAATPDPTAPETPAAVPSGTYCYGATTATLDAAIRLTIAADGQVTGDGVATIEDAANSYYTSYRQTLSGTLSGSTLTVALTTQIENDTQNTAATWTLTGDRLQDGNQTFDVIDCAAVAPRFAAEGDVEGSLEGADLLAAAANVYTQRVTFAPGISSAVVSNGVVRGDRDVYLLAAQAAQTLTLTITALENNAAFDVVSPTGAVLVLDGTNEAVVLPETGDYQVIVGGTRGNAGYDLSITIQ
ncbi:MAG TPA: hypothetical protein V6D02_11430 [Candidatus Obscuribacterales bacterium]